MKVADFMQGLRSTIDVLNRLDVLQQVYRLASLDSSDEFKRYALSANLKYSDLYRIGLRMRDYNFLLDDYSYFQFFRSGDDSDLVLRYAFYFNPFEPISMQELQNLTDDTDYELYFQLLDEQGENSKATMIRYDVALQDYVELRHPAAHFHIGLHESSRWPVSKELSPLTFALFTLKLFYPSKWTLDLDERLARSKNECSELAAEYFSHLERRHLHIT